MFHIRLHLYQIQSLAIISQPLQLYLKKDQWHYPISAPFYLKDVQHSNITARFDISEMYPSFLIHVLIVRQNLPSKILCTIDINVKEWPIGSEKKKKIMFQNGIEIYISLYSQYVSPQDQSDVNQKDIQQSIRELQSQISQMKQRNDHLRQIITQLKLKRDQLSQTQKDLRNKIQAKKIEINTIKVQKAKRIEDIRKESQTLQKQLEEVNQNLGSIVNIVNQSGGSQICSKVLDLLTPNQLFCKYLFNQATSLLFVDIQSVRNRVYNLRSYWLLLLINHQAFDKLLILKFSCYYKRIKFALMAEVIPSFSPLSPKPRKVSRADKQAKIQDQRQKLSEMINQFYEKTKSKIEKTLNKDSKKTFLLCKQLFCAISLHPQQQLYEVTRLNDVLFNQIAILNQKLVNFLRQVQRLREKIGFQLDIQKQRSIIKQQKNETSECHIAFLRKISFKKQKLSLGYRLNDIDVINKKLMKLEEPLKNQNENINGSILEIEGKRLQSQVVRYWKIWFQSKKRYYLLCVMLNSERQVKMCILNDKLQSIAVFSRQILVDVLAITNIVQIQNYIYLVGPHKIVRINLINESQQIMQCFSQKIQRCQVYQNGIVIWVVDLNQNQSIVFLNAELEMYGQNYLKMNTRGILNHFKLATQSYQALYYLTRDQNNIVSLYQLKNMQINLIIKDMGSIEETIPIKRQNIVEYVVFRRSNLFYKFSIDNPILEPLKIDIQNGQSIIKCCVLGEHLYALLQGGKQVQSMQ